MSHSTRSKRIIVIAAKAGIQFFLRAGEELGPGLRRDDGVLQ
jgi:hypothetical protein